MQHCRNTSPKFTELIDEGNLHYEIRKEKTNKYSNILLVSFFLAE